MRSGCELGEAYGQATARVIPLQRFGTPEEVGHAEAFFASLQASYITGQTLVIDGGRVLPEYPAAPTHSRRSQARSCRTSITTTSALRAKISRR